MLFKEQDRKAWHPETDIPVLAAPAAPAAALSHGFGGDTDDMLSDVYASSRSCDSCAPYSFTAEECDS